MRGCRHCLARHQVYAVGSDSICMGFAGNACPCPSKLNYHAHHRQATLERVGARGNTGDLDCQPFYRFIERTYAWHVIAMFAALYAVGGLPVLVWGGALRCAWVYHITWFVNSASHVWGYQSYATGDQRCGPAVPPAV